MSNPRSKATFYFSDGRVEEHDMIKLGDVWYPKHSPDTLRMAERVVLADGTVLKDREP